MFFVTRTSGTRDKFSRGENWRIDPNEKSKGDRESEDERHHKYKVIKDTSKKKKASMVAQQIMHTAKVFLTPDMSLEDAKKHIEGMSVWHIPVLSKEGKLIGLITDRDLNKEKSGKKKVSDIMAKNVLCATPDTEVKNIAKVFFEEQVSAIPIVDEDSKFVGMLTHSDVLQTIVKITSLDI